MRQGGNCNRCNGLIRVGRVSPEGGTSDLEMVARRSSHPIRNHWTSEKYLVLIVPSPQPAHP